MVIERIAAVIFDTLAGVLSAVLPVDADPAGLSETVSGIFPYFAWINSWLPLGEALELAGISLGITIILGSLYAGTWVLTKLHILGGSS